VAVGGESGHDGAFLIGILANQGGAPVFLIPAADAPPARVILVHLHPIEPAAAPNRGCDLHALPGLKHQGAEHGGRVDAPQGVGPAGRAYVDGAANRDVADRKGSLFERAGAGLGGKKPHRQLHLGCDGPGR